MTKSELSWECVHLSTLISYIYILRQLTYCKSIIVNVKTKRVRNRVWSNLQRKRLVSRCKMNSLREGLMGGGGGWGSFHG